MPVQHAPLADELYAAAPLHGMLAAVVDTWDPEWAVVTTDRLRNEQMRDKAGPFLGWMTYLPAARNVRPQLKGAHVSPGSGGSYITIHGTWHDDNIRKVLKVARVLARRGSLRT